MIKILSAIIILLSNITFAITIDVEWTQNLRKNIIVSCAVAESELCLSLCESKTVCQIEEKPCRDLAGTAYYSVRDFFLTVGLSYYNVNQTLNTIDLVNIIKTGNFVTLTSDSVFNFATNFNSEDLKKRFQSLCPSATESPIVIALLNQDSRKLEKFEAVICKDSKSNAEAFFLDHK